jgi:hypothetical protein
VPFLFEIPVSSSIRFDKEEFCFEYKSHRFKYIQKDPMKWADSLLTIIPARKDEYIDNAFSTASEYLSALSWANRSKIHVAIGGGGRGCDQFLKIGEAKSSGNTFPAIFSKGNHLGGKLSPIPNIENDKQRKAISLFREASASNNIYLSFLFYWQIFEVSEELRSKSAVNEMHRSSVVKDPIVMRNINEIDLKSKELGDHLEYTNRHAIAHITRDKDKKDAEIDLDSYTERRKISLNTEIVKSYARHFIQSELKLQKKLHLAERHEGTFPVYYDLELAKKENFRNIKIPYRRSLLPCGCYFVLVTV